MFRRALYPHARPFVILITLLKQYHFAADYDFVNSVAQITRYRDFDLYMQDLDRHPRNGGFLRRGLRLRLSSHRLRIIIRNVMIREKKERMAVPSGHNNQPVVQHDAS